ncbi:hypothetical protein RRG08_006785 [Elysia crispata]|uniref:Uncharacterized protein n=1 Tax=Elysia crispata TaxID=231223 RepID=A0AAE1E6I5_9GAST|nr:hypothetical protein RRG08_006785 [Elysia crispata]
MQNMIGFTRQIAKDQPRVSLLPMSLECGDLEVMLPFLMLLFRSQRFEGRLDPVLKQNLQVSIQRHFALI